MQDKLDTPAEPLRISKYINLLALVEFDSSELQEEDNWNNHN
jgi:hypothetical protein